MVTVVEPVHCQWMVAVSPNQSVVWLLIRRSKLLPHLQNCPQVGNIIKQFQLLKGFWCALNPNTWLHPIDIAIGTGPTSTKPKPKFGGGDICPKCNKTVYFAEAMKADGSTWHKTCFTCNQCNKNLDSSLVCEREGKVYCKSCYGKNFGPKGVGYGIGAGALQTTWIQIKKIPCVYINFIKTR